MFDDMSRAARILCGCAVACAAQRTPAQEVRVAHALHGVVVDSVAGVPLAGAVVQVAIPTSTNAPWTATTDTAGRYQIRGLPAGKLIVGFYHDALTALGLDAPMRTVELTGVDTTVDLAIPSSATIRALRCGESPPFAPGMLVGSVRDAETRGAILGASASVHWRAFALDSANYRVIDQRVAATIEPDGALLACHVPVDVPLNLDVTAAQHWGVQGQVVTIPSNGIGYLDVHLVDSAQTTGTALVRGAVMQDNGRAVTSGTLVIHALQREVPIRDGWFSLGGIPAGSWVAEARVIGAEPREALLEAAERAVTSAQITVGSTPQRLDAVTVVGAMSRDLRVLQDVLRRRRVGAGTSFLPGHPALQSALFVSDVIKEARGFRVVGRESVATFAGCGYVAVYLDGQSLPTAFEGLDARVPRGSILAIETWPNAMYAPVEFRYGFTFPKSARNPEVRMQPCAIVAVWTKRRF